MSAIAMAWILCALAFFAALVAGVFQAFSDFVMKALGDLDGEAGMLAMQRINVTVLRSLFLVSLFLLLPGLLGAGWLTASRGEGPGGWVLGAALLYLLGVVGVTMLRNVPMNEQLDRVVVDGDAREKARYWRHYLRHWTRWNHVRSGASAATAALLLVAAMELVVR
jgi:uncharacterized membrane protein